jgi:hypothetical protein
MGFQQSLEPAATPERQGVVSGMEIRERPSFVAHRANFFIESSFLDCYNQTIT